MKLRFYNVSPEYCKYIRAVDPIVPYLDGEKKNRPFVGIVITVNGVNYYAPLTSPKPKHLKMKNAIDFTKIDNGKYGAINFNNMIPIVENCLTLVDVNPHNDDSMDVVKYKLLLRHQLYWCNSHVDAITKKARTLYKYVTEGKDNARILSRCCNFKVIEQRANTYKHQ